MTLYFPRIRNCLDSCSVLSYFILIFLQNNVKHLRPVQKNEILKHDSNNNLTVTQEATLRELDRLSKRTGITSKIFFFIELKGNRCFSAVIIKTLTHCPLVH